LHMRARAAVVAAFALTAAAGSFAASGGQAAHKAAMVVYKSPT